MPVTVDLRARAILAESTRWLLGARITNYEFDDSIPKTGDPAIREIYGQFLWLLYCDLREHRLTGPDELSHTHRDAAQRCIVFLKSGLPYAWPVLSRTQSVLLAAGNLLTLGAARRIYFRRLSAAGDMAYWPFLTRAQYVAALGSPAYLAGDG